MAAAVDIFIKEIRSDAFDSLMQVLHDDKPKRELINAWSIMYSSWTRQRFALYSRGGGTSFKKGWEEKQFTSFNDSVESAKDIISSPLGARLGTVRVAGVLAVAGISAVESAVNLIEGASALIRHPLKPQSERTYGTSGEKWPPLAESTLAGRRKKGKDAAILRDTGMLFAAVSHLSVRPYFTGSSIRVVIAIDSPQRYPNGSASVGDVAGFHQQGGKHLPKRTILVDLQSVAPRIDQLTGSMAMNVKGRQILESVTGLSMNSAEVTIPEISVLEDATGYKLYNAMLLVAKHIWMRELKHFLGAAGDPTKVLYINPGTGPGPGASGIRMNINLQF